MIERNFHLRLSCDYQTEKNDVHNLKVEINLDDEWKKLHLSTMSPGFLLLVYGLFSCQHLYMRTNCAERDIVLESAHGELKLCAGEFWNIQNVDVNFQVKIKSGTATQDAIDYIIERMGHCPVSTNIPADIKKNVSVDFEKV